MIPFAGPESGKGVVEVGGTSEAERREKSLVNAGPGRGSRW